jgi:hypothetical protein
MRREFAAAKGAAGTRAFEIERQRLVGAGTAIAACNPESLPHGGRRIRAASGLSNSDFMTAV